MSFPSLVYKENIQTFSSHNQEDLAKETKMKLNWIELIWTKSYQQIHLEYQIKVFISETSYTSLQEQKFGTLCNVKAKKEGRETLNHEAKITISINKKITLVRNISFGGKS